MSSSPTVTLRNYRCFDWQHPATIAFGNGFTALVGPNNSGKSSALRAIYELRNYLGNLTQTLSMGQQYKLSTSFLGVADPIELANDKDDRRFQLEITIPHPPQSEYSQQPLAVSATFEFDTYQNFCILKKVTVIALNSEIHLNNEDIRKGQINGHKVTYSEKLLQVDYSAILLFAENLSRSRYYPAFRNAINEGASSYYDIPVGTALVASWDLWKAGDLKVQKKAIARVEREICSLLGFKTLEINADQHKKSLNVSIDGRPHKLYEIGSGVSQLIITMAAALISSPPYILIDEPELNLHPALQVNFLTTLASYCTQGILYSTHSLGLARSTATRIYSTVKLPTGDSKIIPLGEHGINLSQWLGELSYAGRIEIGCEKILLVEGPTDVLFFQEFLRKLNKDAKYVVMQLGGSSLINSKIGIHLTEIIRLVDPKNIYIYIDSEKKSLEDPIAKDRIDFITECVKFGVSAQLSALRATENYLEKNGIQAALGSVYEPLEPYQLLKDAKKKWQKTDNWKIARETSFDDIKNTDLGKFLSLL